MVYFVVFFEELDDDGWLCPEPNDVMKLVEASDGRILTISKIERREDVTDSFKKT